jgi:xanthine dehydrogenase accessory factor
MSNDLSFFRQLTAALTKGPVVVATVIQSTGSVPREVGARLLVSDADGAWGTIGGGAGEAKVLGQARTILATGENRQVNIDLTGAPQRDIQGICGGQMQVWLEHWQGNNALALARQIEATLAAGQPLTLVTPLTRERGSYVEENCSDHPPALRVGSEIPTFRITLQPPPTLLIVGAGHCGIQLATTAQQVGFQIIVQDDRSAWANGEKFPQAQRISNQPIADLVSDLAGYTHLYAALVTRGFDYDLAALRAVLNRQPPCRYIGMIGSQKRVRKVLRAIRAESVSQAALKVMHAPIGLDIGALTPEEIAISIVAELIMVRRGGTGRPLSQNLGR